MKLALLCLILIGTMIDCHSQTSNETINVVNENSKKDSINLQVPDHFLCILNESENGVTYLNHALTAVPCSRWDNEFDEDAFFIDCRLTQVSKAYPGMSSTSSFQLRVTPVDGRYAMDMVLNSKVMYEDGREVGHAHPARCPSFVGYSDNEENQNAKILHYYLNNKEK